MADLAAQPSPDDGLWFHIKVTRPAGPGKGWPSGTTYMTQAIHDALAYQSYMIVADKAYSSSLSAFTWESGGPRGNYLRDQNGWYLGYDTTSRCLCARSKGLSSFWEVQERDGARYLRDITADSRYLSWLPNQKWPLAAQTLFISEEDGMDNALVVAIEMAPAPVSA